MHIPEIPSSGSSRFEPDPIRTQAALGFEMCMDLPPPPPPPPPPRVTATPGSAGGGGGGGWTFVPSELISGTSHTISGLANGIEYEFQARASNLDLSGVWHVSDLDGFGHCNAGAASGRARHPSDLPERPADEVEIGGEGDLGEGDAMGCEKSP